jgi:outer membrane protein assembly factor BamD
VVLTRWLVVGLVALGASGCGSWSSRADILESGTVTQVLEICKTSLDNGNYVRSVECFKRMTGRFPFGPESEQAQLNLAFAQSKMGDSEEALASTNRFIKTYPTHVNVDYAYYLRGLTNYERSQGLLSKLIPEDRATHDPTMSKQAFLDFSEMIKRFPDSEYAPDARARMLALRSQLADSELHVANYYLRRGVYIGALNRAKFIVESYQSTPQSHTALAIMVQCYEALGETALAEEARAVLKLNAPQHAFLTGESTKKRWWLFGG